MRLRHERPDGRDNQHSKDKGENLPEKAVPDVIPEGIVAGPQHQRIGGRGDGRHVTGRGTHGDAHDEGQGAEVHAQSDGNDQRHHDGCGGRIGHDVGQYAGNEHENAEKNIGIAEIADHEIGYQLGSAGLVHGEAHGQHAGEEPDGSPVDARLGLLEGHAAGYDAEHGAQHGGGGQGHQTRGHADDDEEVDAARNPHVYAAFRRFDFLELGHVLTCRRNQEAGEQAEKKGG